MTPTNWPNPERPGVPMFPERDGTHVFYRIDNGEERIADWHNAKKEYANAPYWSRTPADMARYYKYGHCISVKLTPTQIAEMLAGERERCAKVCDALADDFLPCHPSEYAREIRKMADDDTVGMIVCAVAAPAAPLKDEVLG